MGLHARPAAEFVLAAKAFRSQIWLVKGEERFSAASILEVLCANLNCGDTAIIEAEGRDAEEVVKQLADLIRGFGRRDGAAAAAVGDYLGNAAARAGATTAAGIRPCGSHDPRALPNANLLNGHVTNDCRAATTLHSFPTMPEHPVAIIGGGAAGVLAAVHLHQRNPRCKIMLIEKGARPGRGLAYSTDYDCHLLNVRVERMSAFAKDDQHFLRWLRHKSPDDPRDCNRCESKRSERNVGAGP